MDNCIEIKLNLHNRLSHIFIYFYNCPMCNITFSPTSYCSSITLMFTIYNVRCRCTYCCAFVMDCVWPLSPSSCEVGVVAIVVTNWVDGDTPVVVAYSIDFI